MQTTLGSVDEKNFYRGFQGWKFFKGFQKEGGRKKTAPVHDILK